MTLTYPCGSCATASLVRFGRKAVDGLNGDDLAALGLAHGMARRLRRTGIGKPVKLERIFDRVFPEHQIGHRLNTVPPWTNGPVEGMSRKIRNSVVRCFHCEDHDALRQHLARFISACNFLRRLNPLKGLAPTIYPRNPHLGTEQSYLANAIRQMPGLNI